MQTQALVQKANVEKKWAVQRLTEGLSKVQEISMEIFKDGAVTLVQSNETYIKAHLIHAHAIIELHNRQRGVKK